MLQIETFTNGTDPLSRSVTARPIYAELLLQIETNRRRHPPFSKNHPKVPVPFVVVCGRSLLVERIELRLQRIELIQTHKALFARR